MEPMSNVAIIGCSYTDIYQLKRPDTETENWTYKLSQKYPQHQFRNYALQSTGAEYARIVFDECYDWADYILLQTTHIERRSVFVNDGSNNPTLAWKEHLLNDNLSYVRCNGTLVTMQHSNVSVQGKNNMEQKELAYWKYLTPSLTTNLISDDISRKWIKRVAKDPKVVILNFEQNTPGCMWDVFGNPKDWVKNGFVYSEKDHHFTDKGHTQVLNEYVLKTKIKEVL